MGWEATHEAIEESVKIISRLKGQRLIPQSGQLTLDPYLLEEASGYTITPLEEPFDVKEITRLSDDMMKIGLDSYCQSIGCHFATQFITTAAVCTYSIHPIADYPEGPWEYPISISQPYKWVGVLPNTDVQIPTPSNPYVRIFKSGYDRKQAQTELGQGLETHIICNVLPIIADFIRDIGADPFIVLDGCIYFLPSQKLFERASKYKKWGDYAKFYESDIHARVDKINSGYLRQEIPIVGIVKRTGHSHLLISNKGYPRHEQIRELAERLNVNPRAFSNDESFIFELFQRALSLGHISTPCIGVMTSALQVDYSTLKSFREGFRELGEVLHRNPKVYIYVGLFSHPLLRDYFEIFRIETTKRIYDKFGDTLWIEAISDAICRSCTLPSSIIYADKRCRDWSSVLFKHSGKTFIKHGLYLDYDTRARLME